MGIHIYIYEELVSKKMGYPSNFISGLLRGGAWGAFIPFDLQNLIFCVPVGPFKISQGGANISDGNTKWFTLDLCWVGRFLYYNCNERIRYSALK